MVAFIGELEKLVFSLRYKSNQKATAWQMPLLVFGMDIVKLRGVNFSNLKGDIGIAHCRWATCGGVTKKNAHPHTSCDDKISIVHNGIIENFIELKDFLLKKGHKFKSETDSEVIVHFQVMF